MNVYVRCVCTGNALCAMHDIRFDRLCAASCMHTLKTGSSAGVGYSVPVGCMGRLANVDMSVCYQLLSGLLGTFFSGNSGARRGQDIPNLFKFPKTMITRHTQASKKAPATLYKNLLKPLLVKLSAIFFKNKKYQSSSSKHPRKW